MTDHLPQPYPLWCVERYKDGDETTVSRVVAWWVADDRAPSHDLVPILARTVGTITTADVVGLAPGDDSPRLFFGDSAEAAMQAAQDYGPAQ